MQLNHASTSGDQPSCSPNSTDRLSVSAESIDGSSHALMEIAGLLYEGRMDGENATMCRVPRSHQDVAANVDTFARFAQDQYNDVVVLLAALSGKLRSSGNDYTEFEEDVQRQMNTFLDCGSFIDPKDR
jgi:hypothetical protein